MITEVFVKRIQNPSDILPSPASFRLFSFFSKQFYRLQTVDFGWTRTLTSQLMGRSRLLFHLFHSFQTNLITVQCHTYCKKANCPQSNCPIWRELYFGETSIPADERRLKNDEKYPKMIHFPVFIIFFFVFWDIF